MKQHALALFAILWLAPEAMTQPDPSGTTPLVSTSCIAEQDDDRGWHDNDDDDRGWRDNDDGDCRDRGWGGDGDGGHPAPEIDPGLLVAGMVLLAGGSAVLLGQRRKRRSVDLG